MRFGLGQEIPTKSFVLKSKWIFYVQGQKQHIIPNSYAKSNCYFVAKIQAFEYGLTLEGNVWESHDGVLILYTQTWRTVTPSVELN